MFGGAAQTTIVMLINVVLTYFYGFCGVSPKKRMFEAEDGLGDFLAGVRKVAMEEV